MSGDYIVPIFSNSYTILFLVAFTLSCSISKIDVIIQARAEPLSGKVERLVTWKWAEHPVKGAESEMDDDVIAGT